MAADRALISSLRKELQTAADATKAPGMQAYMKSTMPYYGVSSVPLRKILKELFADHPLDGVDRWRDTVLDLWRKAKFREERYAAIELTGHKLYREHQTPDVALPMYDEMIVTGAWWDYVDHVGIHRIGPLLRSHPKALRPVVKRWSTDGDLWRRRTSIICQISFRGDADLDLLYANIEPNLADKDFFIRKAIGWALRTYAWADPAEVVRYVEANQARLSPLSQREALKNVHGRRKG
ncbi:MAG TPA: DNA alkylation repair protein [Acidimicrobiales bacterium]|nr:DNA alkylation repair protein [Acidimicrobiales bacterium]